jgi:N6-L-threonylcarbamoyladenine synthase
VLGNALYSQIAVHAQYGGVFPKLAKREHAKNLPHILKQALEEAGMWKIGAKRDADWNAIAEILKKEDNLGKDLKALLENIENPAIDIIAVTAGPGLEPALWVGVSFAKALEKLWGVPAIPVNHMEGHIFSILTSNEKLIKFPALALLISGGHTELVKMEGFGQYEVIGKTVDDAVGEAYDKTARMLGFPYPGGPEISKLSQYARENSLPQKAKFPRPMLHSGNLDFSFAGLKTAVLYYLRDHFGFGSEHAKEPTQDEKADIAREADDAIAEVLSEKTKMALAETGAKTLIVAGGVIADKRLRGIFKDFEAEYPGLSVDIPERKMTTDNAVMIACAAYIRLCIDPKLTTYPQHIAANGNLSLD